MADSQFDILIKFGLSKEKAVEADAEIKKVGQAGVEQEVAVEAAVGKTITKKEQLKGVIKGLGREFPILSHIAHLALNPIALSVGAIVAAFGAMKQNLSNIRESFSGFELPGTKKSEMNQVSELAVEYDKLSQAVNKAGDSLSTFKTKLSESQEVLATNDKFLRALGINTGTQAAELSQALGSDAAAKLYDSGSDKVRRGSKISPDELNSLKTDAEAGSAQMEKQKERRAFLADYKAGKVSAAQFAWRYGSDASLGEAEAAEGVTEGQAQFAIGRYARARNRSALYAQGESEIAEANKLGRSNLSARRDTFAGSGEAVAKAAANLEGIDFLRLPAAVLALAKALEDAQRLMEKAAQDAKVVNARIENQATRP